MGNVEDFFKELGLDIGDYRIETLTPYTYASGFIFGNSIFTSTDDPEVKVHEIGHLIQEDPEREVQLEFLEIESAALQKLKELSGLFNELFSAERPSYLNKDLKSEFERVLKAGGLDVEVGEIIRDNNIPSFLEVAQDYGLVLAGTYMKKIWVGEKPSDDGQYPGYKGYAQGVVEACEEIVETSYEEVRESYASEMENIKTREEKLRGVSKPQTVIEEFVIEELENIRKEREFLEKSRAAFEKMTPSAYEKYQGELGEKSTELKEYLKKMDELTDREKEPRDEKSVFVREGFSEFLRLLYRLYVRYGEFDLNKIQDVFSESDQRLYDQFMQLENKKFHADGIEYGFSDFYFDIGKRTDLKTTLEIGKRSYNFDLLRENMAEYIQDEKANRYLQSRLNLIEESIENATFHSFNLPSL